MAVTPLFGVRGLKYKQRNCFQQQQGGPISGRLAACFCIISCRSFQAPDIGEKGKNRG